MNAYLAHHGIKGQKWGERKYQYKDGSLTPEGRKRYGVIGSTKAYISQRRKNARASWKKDDALDTWHDSKVSPVYKKEKSKQISRKEANREYDRYWEEYEGKLRDVKKETKAANKRASKQYRADLKRGLDDKVSRIKKSVSDSKQTRLEKQAKRGRMSSWDQIRNTGIRAVQGEAVARQAGKLLIKRAMKNNPNLKLSDPDVQSLVNQAGDFGFKAGIAYSRFETVQGYAARKKLYGDATADPWVSEHSVLNKRKK